MSDSALSPKHDAAGRQRTLALALGISAALLALRIAGLMLDPSSLYADETQYWVWSRALDWGYFSKPPLIAWIIAGTTGLFGDSDWAVRLAAPLLHTATAAFLALSAGRLFGREAAFWTLLAWLTLPSVWLSAAVMSTDAVLLTFWSLSLYAFIRLRDGGGWGAALLMGTGIGLGLLAKYAMGYFIAGLALAAILDAPSRRALLHPRLILSGVTALVILAPNLVWNWRNDFATVSHTAANANWGADMFNPGEAASFLFDQAAVFGPAFIAVLFFVIYRLARDWRAGKASRVMLTLACFCVPALLIVTGQAFLSRAHANWAVSAYAAGTLLTVAFLLQGPRWRRYVLAGSVALHTLVGASFATFAINPQLAEAAGLANAFKRVRGWPETAGALAEAVERAGVNTLVFDNRNDFHQMQRYGGAIQADLYMWMRYAGPVNHAELGWALPAGYAGPVLIASEREQEVPVLARDFTRMDYAGDIAIDLGGGRERIYALFIAEDYQPVPRTPELEAEIEAEREALRAR
ncbi:MAG: ArnT family glycosyltransferase [Glycocaulis sp.]